MNSELLGGTWLGSGLGLGLGFGFGFGFGLGLGVGFGFGLGLGLELGLDGELLAASVLEGDPPRHADGGAQAVEQRELVAVSAHRQRYLVGVRVRVSSQ